MSNTYQKYSDNISTFDRILRFIWLISRLFLFKPFSLPFFNGWRITVLRIFGAKIGKGSIIYSSANIIAPWNLKMGEFSCIGPQVELHLGKTTLGSRVTVSQRTYLCSASHDIKYLSTPLITGTITIDDNAWVAAECFIMMNVHIGEGSIVGARSAVFKNVEPWTVVGGNPASFLKKRTIHES